MLSWVPWDGHEVVLGRRGAQGRWELEAGVGGASVCGPHLRLQVHVKSPREGMGDGKKEGLMSSWSNSVSQGLEGLSRPGEKVQPGGQKSAQGGHSEGQQKVRSREQGGPEHGCERGEAERVPGPQHCCSHAQTLVHLSRGTSQGMCAGTFWKLPCCPHSAHCQVVATPHSEWGFVLCSCFPLSVVLQPFGPWGHFGDQWLTGNVIAVSSL